MNTKVHEFFEALRQGRYAHGGYPLLHVMTDGSVLCPGCAYEERFQIGRSTRDGMHDGWEWAGCDANYESIEFCDHCGERIPTAYLEDDIAAAEEASAQFSDEGISLTCDGPGEFRVSTDWQEEGTFATLDEAIAFAKGLSA